MMSLRSIFLKRCFSLPSTSSAPYIDYSFSEKIVQKSATQIDEWSREYLYGIRYESRNVRDVKKKIMKIRRALNKSIHPDIRLVPIGSAANHLLTSHSDLDLVLLPSKNEKEWRIFINKFGSNTEFRKQYMEKMGSMICKAKVGGNSQVFYRARVPIIRFGAHGLQVDIQFGNIAPIRSSLFVRTCVETDERVSLLIHWLTSHFRSARLLNSRIGLFSQYHVNLLVIHFLQAIPYPVLPDVIELSPWLQTSNDWNNSVKVLTREGSLYVPWSSQNEQSVGELAVQLVDYFSQIDFDKYAIDTRGRVTERNDDGCSQFQLIDEYFTESTCRVARSDFNVRTLFKKMKRLLENEEIEKFFKFKPVKKTQIPPNLSFELEMSSARSTR